MDFDESVAKASAASDVPNLEEVSCNLENVYEYLKEALVGSDDIDLLGYLNAYKELYNFFVLLGGAFSFVSSDVKTKIKIIEDLREVKKVEFATISKMLHYEKSNDMFADKKYVSGSRTLLRLHRGFDFVQQFLGEIYKIDEAEKTGGVCREVYDKTLGNFHPWAIRKGAHIAMKLLPVKKDLIKRITKDDPAVKKRIEEVMPDMFVVMADAYKRTEALYTKYELHNLS